MNPQALTTAVARVLLAAIFVMSGIGKFANLAGTAGYIASAGLPLSQLLAVAAAGLEVIGGVLLVIGWQARWAALALAGFTVFASLLFHNFWAMPAEQQFMQQLMFMKNLAITGGLLFVFGAGPGRLSLDARATAAA
jgi:putative oxidoreductase